MMVAHTYLFHKLHPEFFAECLENRHRIEFWYQGRQVATKVFDQNDLGNFTISLPEAVSGKLSAGTAFFKVTPSSTEGPDLAFPTLVLTGHYFEN